jgi:metal-responsive CopG/Arc/MetJ family transcriptional regulator
MSTAKAKVSLTIASDLLDRIDREAARLGTTRSALVEQYVRSAANRAAERSLDEMTAAYYASVTDDDAAETEAIARASSRAAKRITYDVPARGAMRRPRRRQR